MSAQNAKKKRMGSRRKAVNQNQIADDDERPLTDTSGAQSCTSGKTTEVTEVVNYQDGLTEVPPNGPSPELQNKRKFGSRRKQKGLHVGDFATALHNKEDVEGTTDSSEITVQASMEIQTQNAQELNQEFEDETFQGADSHFLSSHPHCYSSEFKGSSGRKYLETDGERANNENLTEDNDKTYFQSEKIGNSSPEKLGEKLELNVEPFVISVDHDLTDEGNDKNREEELSEKEFEETKNDSELLRQMEDFRGHHFQSESPKVDDSWPKIDADLTCNSKQEVSLPLNEESLEDGQNEHLDLQVHGNLISVEAVDRIHVQHGRSNAYHETTDTMKSFTHDITGRVTEEAKIMFQSELSTDISAAMQDDLSPVNEEVMPKTFTEVEKEDILPSEVNMTHCIDENVGLGAKERVLSEVEQSNSSLEAKQNPLLPDADYNHRFTGNIMAKNSNNEPTATSTVSPEVETETQEDSTEPILKDVYPTLAENPSDEDKRCMQTVISDDDASEHFSTDLTVDGMQIDQSHFMDILEELRTDVSVNKDEEVNLENKQDDHQTEAMALGANILNDTKNTQVSGMDRADTEPGVVYKSEDQVDDETKSQALDSDVQANLDLPPTQLQQMDTISNLLGGRRKLGSSRKKKLKPHAQDIDLSQQPAEEATGHSGDHEPFEVTLSLALETEVSVQVGSQSGIKSGSDPATLSEEGKDDVNLAVVKELLCSVDSSGKVDDEMETLQVDDSLILQSNSSLQSSSVVDRESMDPTLDENPSDQVKKSMETDFLDAASEYFSTDLTMSGMQMDQSRFTDMQEDFSNVHSGTEIHGNEDDELLRNNHSASLSPPISVNIPKTSEIYSSRDVAVTDSGTDNTLVVLTKDNYPLVDGKGDYQLEDINVCNVLSKTNCLEADSKRGSPNSETHQDLFGGADDFQGKVSAGTSLDDWENPHSHSPDLSSSHHSKSFPITFDEEGIKASHLHDISCSSENDVSDTCMSESGFKTGIDVSVSKEEELNCESKLEGDQTEVNEFGAFPQTSEVSRRKLGSSRKKKLKQHAQDTDLSQQPTDDATGNSSDLEPLEMTLSSASETKVTDQVDEISHGVTHGDVPELDASNLLSGATSNQQSAEVRQGLINMFSATKLKEQGEYSDILGEDQNLQLLASESQMKSTDKEASTVLMISTDTSKLEDQSDIEFSSDPSTMSEKDKDLPEGRGFIFSVDSSGKVDEDVERPPVDDYLVLQSDSSFKSVVEGESTDSVPGEEILLSEHTMTDMEIEESSKTHNGDRIDSRYESVTTHSIQAVEADSHPSSKNSLGENIAMDHASEEFAKEVGMSVSMQGSGRDEIAEHTEDLTEDTSAQEKNEALDQFGFQENSGEEPTCNVPEEDQQSTAEGACSIQQIQFDNCENLQTQTKQKRRKMGSTRRANFNRNQEEDDSCNETKSTQADPNNFAEGKEVDERFSSIITEVPHCENSGAPTIPQNSVQSNTATNVSAAVVKEELNSVILVKADDIKNSERNSGASMEELQPDDLTHTEASSPLYPGHATNTNWSSECVDGVTQGTQGDKDRLESVLPDQLLESAAKLIVAANLEKVTSELEVGDGENPNNLSGQVKLDENLDSRSASFKSEVKRRKMGSTRKNLASRREGEDKSRKQEDREATEEASEEATKVESINTDALKTEDKELTQPKVIVLETVEQSSASESYSRPQAAAEEDQLARIFSPPTVSTSPQPDVMSETAAGGRRRKLGSHRKSHGYQRNRDQILGQKGTGDSQTEATKSSSDKAAVESQSLDKISEDEIDKKTPNTTTAKAAEQPNLQGSTSTQETASPHPSAKRPGTPESPKTLSLVPHSSGEALPSKRYNVILIGDSSVGKTSFMKRVQTGKFSLDLPASVGTDSCISSVLVDGKRVVLQLWDTAGQERFHSITRQIFHKAQAFLLMYDITSSQSFSDISYWANCIQESASDSVTIVLLGNKSDSGTRQVKSQDGEILAKEYNFQFMECSAATGHNVTQSLEAVARVLSEKCDTMEEALLLRQEPQKKKSSGCC